MWWYRLGPKMRWIQSLLAFREDPHISRLTFSEKIITTPFAIPLNLYLLVLCPSELRRKWTLALLSISIDSAKRLRITIHRTAYRTSLTLTLTLTFTLTSSHFCNEKQTTTTPSPIQRAPPPPFICFSLLFSPPLSLGSYASFLYSVQPFSCFREADQKHKHTASLVAVVVPIHFLSYQYPDGRRSAAVRRVPCQCGVLLKISVFKVWWKSWLTWMFWGTAPAGRTQPWLGQNSR